MLMYLAYNATKTDAKERKHSMTTYFLVIVISSGISIFSKKKKKKGMRLDFNNRYSSVLIHKESGVNFFRIIFTKKAGFSLNFKLFF